MLFENNFNSGNFDMDLTIFDIPGSNFKSGKYFSPKEGFLRGNMIPAEYKPYRNLTYLPLIPKTEREAKLILVSELDFAITDLNLILDLHPEDQETFELFKRYIKDYEAAKKEFEKKYGPLCLTNTDGAKYVWLKNPWPWDNEGGSMYV